MKNSIKLKTLVSFTFVIFFFPLLQTCSDKSLENSPIHKVEANKSIEIDSTEILNPLPSQTEIIVDNENRKKDFIFIKREYTVNFYQLLSRTFGDINLNEYNKSTFEDKTLYPLLSFLLIFINSILILISTFINKYNITFKLSILNITLFILSTLGLILSEIVEDMNQFKIGYYLLGLNIIFIIIVTKKELKNQKNYS